MKPADSIVFISSNSEAEVRVVPEADTTFSSIIVDPMSSAPALRPI